LRPTALVSLFPYTTLFRSREKDLEELLDRGAPEDIREAGVFDVESRNTRPRGREDQEHDDRESQCDLRLDSEPESNNEERGERKDRKSTRLNSSHVSTSYA